MISESLQIKVSNLANSPGVYQFFDKSEKIIYVGKAKNLKKRVSSYFRKNLGSQKTKNLVKNGPNSFFTVRQLLPRNFGSYCFCDLCFF